MIHEHSFKPELIIQIGAGGTGCRITSELCFFIRGNHTELANTKYIIVDHDHVSESNLSRQVYFPHEVNRSKGMVLVDRYKSLIPINQIPEPINSTTITRVFNEQVLARKLLVICSADNSLVVKQVLEHLSNNATNDWYWIFTGANLVQETIAGTDIQTGAGQAYAYGKVNGLPLYPLPPTEVLTDIMQATGFGPSSTGQGCGVTESSGAQTPVMNDSCCSYTMQLINMFFEHGIFIPSVYFVDGVSVTYGDPISVSSLFENTAPTEAVDTEPELEVSSVVEETEESVTPESDELAAIPF